MRGAKPGTATTKKNISVTRKNRLPKAPRIPDSRFSTRSATLLGSIFCSADLLDVVVQAQAGQPRLDLVGEV